MSDLSLQKRLREVCAQALPFPGGGDTPERHRRLFDVAAEDVSLAKLAEAHWDALAILEEAGRPAQKGAVYGVWASEIPGKPLMLEGHHLSGEKAFCSGWGLIDRALVTVGGTSGLLLDIDVRQDEAVWGDTSQWQPEAFRATSTGAVHFQGASLEPTAIVGASGFYLSRPGFWHGACGPAACWAGGASGLLEFADASARSDAHTVAHKAAMHANVWAMRSLLNTAGCEIDATPTNYGEAHRRALTLRHLIEQLATDTLRRFARAYGPFPLTMHASVSRRFHEVEIFLRQSHAERDLEALGHLAQQPSTT